MRNFRAAVLYTALGLAAILGASPALADVAAADAARAGDMQKLNFAEPKALPEIGLVGMDDAPRSLAEYRGKWVLVNFWATWCPPCVAEMPALDRAQAALSPQGIEVLALSSDRAGRGVVEPFYRRTELQHLKMWFDARGATGRALGIRGLPTTLILDRGGREVARLEGEAAWDSPAMLAAIRRLVGGAPPANTTSST